MEMKTPGWVLKKKEDTVVVLHKILGGETPAWRMNLRYEWAACPALPLPPAPWPALPCWLPLPLYAAATGYAAG